MSMQFNNILVPADLTVNTEIAIKKALEVANQGATIHLLHVMQSSMSVFLAAAIKNKGNNHQERNCIEKYLQQWRTAIQESEKELKACAWITYNDSIQKGIEQFSKKNHPDLIIIGKHSYRPWSIFNEKVICSRLVINTGIAVLSVKPGSFYNKTRKLIVPLESQIPEEKMNMIIGISNTYKLKIVLLSFVPEKNSDIAFHAASLLNTYRWLRSSLRCPVEYIVLNQRNRPKSLLGYAKKIDGNILLVFAGMETDSGLMKRDITDAVLPESNIEILTIKKNTSIVK